MIFWIRICSVLYSSSYFTSWRWNLLVPHAHKKRKFWLDNSYQERHTKILSTITVFDSRSSPTNQSIISLSLVTFLWEIITYYITSLLIIYINITPMYILCRKWCIVLKVICNDILITSYSKTKLGNYRDSKGKKTKCTHLRIV